MARKYKKILALIPARAGSKGLTGKNTRLFLRKPLIAWTIEQALNSRYIDKVVVSTESPAIAFIARRYGAEVPFVRPSRLAASSAKTTDVVLHALSHFSKRGINYDIIVLLQPTSPLRTHADIDKSLQKLLAGGSAAVVSICKEEHSPLWNVTLTPGKRIGRFLGKGAQRQNRQSLPIFYRINGAVYAAHVGYFKRNKGFFGKSTLAYIMPQERSVDIDSAFDFKIAGILKKIWR